MNAASFLQIGSDVIVANGAVATSAAWAGLLPGAQYEWYATVNDGTTTTPGPIWSFTTQPLATAAPVITSQPTSLTVTAGNKAIFTAQAVGIPAPSVQWELCTNLICNDHHTGPLSVGPPCRHMALGVC
jgi:hypothetical protein